MLFVATPDRRYTSDYYVPIIKGSFLKEINRGGLGIPGDSACFWTLYCYVVFH